MKRPYPRLIGYILVLLVIFGCIHFFPESFNGAPMLWFGSFVIISAGFEHHEFSFLIGVISILVMTGCIIPWCYKTTWKSIALAIVGIIISVFSGGWAVYIMCMG